MKVTITVSGPTGSGKSRIIRAIEFALKHAGLTAEIVEKQTHRSADTIRNQVRWDNGEPFQGEGK